MRLDYSSQPVSHPASHRNGQLVFRLQGDTFAEAWRKDNRETAPLMMPQTKDPNIQPSIAPDTETTNPPNNQIPRGYGCPQRNPSRSCGYRLRSYCFSKHFSPRPGFCLGRFYQLFTYSPQINKIYKIHSYDSSP